MVYTTRGMSVTSEHRVLCKTFDSDQIGYDFVQYDDLTGKEYRIPSAGINLNSAGLDMTSSEMVFLLETQRIGVIDDENQTITFKFVVESALGYFRTLIKNIGFECEFIPETLGPVNCVVSDKRAYELVKTYLTDNKDFNWKWLDMSPTQFSYFIYKITSHEDGTWRRKYESDSMENINIVQALCALNERGSHYSKKDKVMYISEPYRMITNAYVKRVDDDIEVSCVTVKSGAFLMRQHGYTTITGNCPGEYIFSRAQEICDLVNAQLEEKPEHTPVASDIKAGDLVKITSGAVWYGTTSAVPSWVIAQNWYVNSVSGDRAVLGKNEKGDADVNSAIDVKYLTVVKPKENSTPVQDSFKPYTKQLNAGTTLYSITNNIVRSIGSIKTSGVYTISAEMTVSNVVYGCLKSGAGWVYLKKVTPVVDNTIRVGDYVKVLKGVTYDGKTFKVYASKYKVLQIKGDRVVISSDGKNVTAAVKASNLQKL
jgi:transcription antitermination factor NusG